MTDLFTSALRSAERVEPAPHTDPPHLSVAEPTRGGSATDSSVGGVARARAASGWVATPLRVVPDGPGVDLEAAEVAATAFLTALGISLDSESMAASPGRMARAWSEMLTPRSFDLTTFPNDEGYDQLVVARSLPVQSVCEHHLLPFTGVAHVGYLPGDRILGLSKLARVVELFSRRPLVMERITQQIARWLLDTLAPRGVGVVIEADHQCMSLRGVRAPEASTVTSALLGCLRDDAGSRAEFLAVAMPTPH
jgi:GTP cyclohydrolase I